MPYFTDKMKKGLLEAIDKTDQSKRLFKKGDEIAILCHNNKSLFLAPGCVAEDQNDLLDPVRFWCACGCNNPKVNEQKMDFEIIILKSDLPKDLLNSVKEVMN